VSFARGTGLALLLAGAAALLWLRAGGSEPPAFASVRDGWRPSVAHLLDRHGEVIHVRRIDLSIQRLAWVRLGEVPPTLVRALLAAEDRGFRDHSGIDWRAVARAAVARATGTPAGGASTLSMQLASLLAPGGGPPPGGRSPWQKLAQMRAALALERRWTKDEILEAYVNLVGVRGELQGVPAATRVLFGKSPDGLTAAESALLVALLPAPNAPVAGVAARACRVAGAAGFGIECAALHRLAQQVLLGPRPPADEPGLAPHVAVRLLVTAGARVTSTLDARIQTQVADVLRRQVIELADGNARDAAAVVLDNASGEVLAWVGSAGPASRARAVDGVVALRQAGSTLKPFLYGLAIERGYVTAVSLLDDAPLALDTGVGLYVPQNYDRDFKGTVSVRTALASSLNTPAIRLLELVGVDALVERLRDFGHASLTQTGEHYGHALALGAADVSLLAQANAYRALANGGVWSEVRLRPGQAAAPARRALSPVAAYIVSDILSDPAARAPTFGVGGPLQTRYWAAAKTGTSKNLRDNWCLGYTRDYTVGVWVGNFEGDPMRDVSGVSGAAPAWREIVDALHPRPPAAPAVPPGLIVTPVRFAPPVEPPRTEWFVAGTETDLVRLAGADGRPRIVAPPDGVVVAVDPDIPGGHQAIVLEAAPADPQASWRLDGRQLGAAGAPLRWTPSPGRHRLELRDAAGDTLDAATVRVRGLPARQVSAAD
jgi:penicillin-binding protein 1C